MQVIGLIIFIGIAAAAVVAVRYLAIFKLSASMGFRYTLMIMNWRSYAMLCLLPALNMFQGASSSRVLFFEQVS